MTRANGAVTVPDEAGYFRMVRAAFGQRRKTAVNAIASGLSLPKEQVAAAVRAAGFDERIRPEQLTLEDFAALFAAHALCLSLRHRRFFFCCNSRRRSSSSSLGLSRCPPLLF